MARLGIADLLDDSRRCRGLSRLGTRRVEHARARRHQAPPFVEAYGRVVDHLAAAARGRRPRSAQESGVLKARAVASAIAQCRSSCDAYDSGFIPALAVILSPTWSSDMPSSRPSICASFNGSFPQ
jgi:hypothetical protein